MKPDALRAASRVLLVVAIGWAPIWVLSSLLAMGWIPGSSWSIPVGLVALLAGAALLVPAILAAIVGLVRLILKRQLDVVAVIPLIIGVVAITLARNMPSRPGIAFSLHGDEFVELIRSTAAELQRGDGQELRLPVSGLYERASMYRAYGGAIVTEFVVGDFYLPLVHISTDNPDDVRDTCSQGGMVIERLEPCWYVCRRDWN